MSPPTKPVRFTQGATHSGGVPHAKPAQTKAWRRIRWAQVPRPSRKFGIEGSLTGDITLAQPLGVTQISAGGVLIETCRSLWLKSLHELRFALEGASLVVRGRVVHSHVADL